MYLFKLRNIFSVLPLSVLSLAIIIPSTGYAQNQPASTTPSHTSELSPSSVPTAAATKEEDKNLKPGVLASSGRYQKVASQGATNSEAPGEKPIPIVAKVIKEKGGDSCNVEVTNTSDKDSYSVNYAVISKDEKGKIISRNTYSASLGPKKSQSRTVTCRKDLNLEVQMTKGRKTN